LKSLEVDESIAHAIADWIDRDDDASSAASAESGFYTTLPDPYRAANTTLTSIDELYRVRGVNADVMRKLSPFVTALPKRNLERTLINVNTVSREVLTAIYGTAPPQAIDDILAKREVPITDVATLANIKELPQGITPTFLWTKSQYFNAVFSITGQRAQVRQTALIAFSTSTASAGTGGTSNSQSWPVIIWVKES
jgi:type II secretory pathway component PulK